jgi:hypothetical protein
MVSKPGPRFAVLPGILRVSLFLTFSEGSKVAPNSLGKLIDIELAAILLLPFTSS